MDANKPLKQITIRPNGTKRVASIPQGETKTQQQFVKQSDVNNIMKQYKATGTIVYKRNAQEGVYTDMTNLSYQEALDSVRAADQAFQQVPAQLRERFGHNPENLIKYLQNPANTEEAYSLGLKVRPPIKPGPDSAPADQQTPVTPPA